ncbi:MAG: hypothetical protein ACP5EN_02485 [Rhodovulum sp.]
MRSYQAARFYFSFLGFLSWCIIVFGGIVVAIAISSADDLAQNIGIVFIPVLLGIGGTIGLAGFMGLVLVQIGRAGVDSAEYAQQSLKVARDQLEISRSAMFAGGDRPAGFEDLHAEPDPIEPAQSVAAAPEPKAPTVPVAAEPAAPEPKEEAPPAIEDQTIEHRGQLIEQRDGRYYVGTESFFNLSYAKGFVNSRLDSKQKS